MSNTDPTSAHHPRSGEAGFEDAPTRPDAPAVTPVDGLLDLAAQRASAPTPSCPSWESFTPDQTKQLAGYGFDAGGAMVVQFRKPSADGTVAYRYANPPPEAVQGMATASSMGSAVHTYVRNLPFTRLGAVPPECLAAAAPSVLSPKEK